MNFFQESLQGTLSISTSILAYLHYDLWIPELSGKSYCFKSSSYVNLLQKPQETNTVNSSTRLNLVS